jgi:hypothetical protein
LWHYKIGAKELSNFSSYQMLTAYKNWWTYKTPKKLVKKLAVMTANSY